MLLPAVHLDVRLLYHAHIPLLIDLLRTVWPRHRTGVRSVELTVSVDPFTASEWLEETEPTTHQRVCIDGSSARGEALRQLLSGTQPCDEVDSDTVLEMIPFDDGAFVIHPRGGVVYIPDARAVLVAAPSLVDRETQDHEDEAVSIHDTTSVQVLACMVTYCGPRMLPQLLALIRVGFPTLRSLKLHVLRGNKISSESLDAIVRTYPMLEALALRGTTLTSLDVMLAAVDEGLCSCLRVLSLDAGSLGFAQFFETLADSRSPLSKTLTELKINYVNDANGVYLEALETLLARNCVLYFLELVMHRQDPATVSRVAAALGKWHRIPLVTPHTESAKERRCRLAFMSLANHHTHAARFLNRGVLGLILSFAAPYVIRLIHLRHETSRRPAKII